MMDCRHPDLRRQSEPLQPNEVDWMLLETTLWPGHGEGHPSGPVHCATLLLSCSRTQCVGQRLACSDNQAHHQTCTYARGSWSSIDAGTFTAGSPTRTPSHAIVFADEHGGLSAQEVDGLVRVMKDAGIQTVIVVCADAHVRDGIPHADAFVVGSVRTDLETAAMLTDIVHNGLNAPARILCVDDDDLQGVLGTARAPSILAEGLWHLEPHRFDFMAEADAIAFETASAVLASPILGSYRISELSQLRRDILTRLRRDDIPVAFNWPMHGFQFASNSPRAALVRLLCKP